MMMEGRQWTPREDLILFDLVYESCLSGEIGISLLHLPPQNWFAWKEYSEKKPLVPERTVRVASSSVVRFSFFSFPLFFFFLFFPSLSLSLLG
jgi:hypothetical protein